MMLHVHTRSLSTSADSRTRTINRRHARRLSGPIDGDLAAVSFSRLSISPVEDIEMTMPHKRSPTLPPQSSSHENAPSLPNPPNTTDRSTNDFEEDTSMSDCGLPITAELLHRSLIAMDTRSVADRMSASPGPNPLSSPLSSATTHKEQIDEEMPKVTSVEVLFAPDAGDVDKTHQPAFSPDGLPIPIAHTHTPQTSSSYSHDSSSATIVSASKPSSRDNSVYGDVSPKASSPLPPSSMPTSPATSNPTSPYESHVPLRDTDTSCPAIISMSVDDLRTCSPAWSTQPVPSSPVQTSERLVASSPPPSSVLGKRASSEFEDVPKLVVGSSPVKRIRTDGIRSSPPPVTIRRQTPTSQQRSRKKLITPFRPPTIVRKSPPALVEQVTAAPNNHCTPLATTACSAPPNVAKTMTKLARSSRAAAQFKSPMAARPAGSGREVVLPTAMILTLERKVTALRRAIKIERDRDEEKLAALARKWREAGREAAYELWDIVRGMATDSGHVDGTPASDSWRSSWGWEGKDEQEGDNGEDDAMKVEEEQEEVKREETLGVMLRKLNIDPATLGWDDALESFIG
ncbi:unnamed protein product [Peniophora sp. CBMAI 1063]|nr:unnamed protein product [Peniophora sp. CBMAI 1063]